MTTASNSKTLRTIPLLIAVCLLSFPAHAQYSGGTGEPNDPYLIYTAEQMNTIGTEPNDWDKHFKLMADIDLSAYTGASFNIIGFPAETSVPSVPFTGVFDGNGHTISKFSYISTERNFIGLFEFVQGENALIKDLGLINPNVDAGISYGEQYIGSLVGILGHGTINNCYAQGGSVMGDLIVGGGLVGYNDGRIDNCYSSGNVSGNDSVGGLVGYNDGTIMNCYSSGDVSGNLLVGGLVGENFMDGTIANCYATASASGDQYVGGLVGRNGGTTDDCYATGSVTGTADVGGLVGACNQYGMGEVAFSFWDIQTSGQATSAGGTGKTTAEMQDPNTFMDAGWDFIGIPDGPHDIWAMHLEGGYPILWWQLSSLPPLSTFSVGTGEQNNPYLIGTAEELNIIGHNPRLMNAHFKLKNDIDLIGVDFFIIGSKWFPFTGVFDGNGYTISNFNYTSTNTGNIGLLGYVKGENAEIRDLGLISPNIAGIHGVGSLVGQLSYGILNGCYVEGGSVSGALVVGALVGDNSRDASIANCYAIASVSGDQYISGLVGQNTGTITDCYAICNISGEKNIGGLVGSNYRTITNCYSAGSVIGDVDVGGLVGTNSGNGTIIDCYVTSSVVGIKRVGGLIGSGGGAHNSFWDVQSSGQTTSDGGKGRTTAQMQMASTYLGWNECGNDRIWTINEGNDYPRLWWENKPGEVLETQPLSTLLTGSGTQDNPYLIYTAEELNVIGLFPCELDKHFKLMSDIDLSHYVGTEFNIIGVPKPFSGLFDGNGNKITNLNHNRGLFLSVSGAIKDLRLIDFKIDAVIGSSIGSLVGNLQGGTITNCYATGSVSAYGIGWLSGVLGGLVGRNYGTIDKCYSSCDVSGHLNVGGLVGYNGETITNCYSNGDVSGYMYVGGLVSYNGGTITYCYSSSNCSGDQTVGGLVGAANRSGMREDTLSFWDIQTSGRSASAGGTGKTTVEMQTASTFLEAGWDFMDETENGTEDIWWILEGQDYPRLW